MTNVDRVQDIYQAFGAGDIPRILSYLSASVEWEYGPNSTNVPWLQPRRGASNVGPFFETLRTLEIRRFAVKHVVGTGDVVVALLDFEATVIATGRTITEDDEVHIWHFDADGKVARFRHRIDTHQHQLAYRPA